MRSKSEDDKFWERVATGSTIDSSAALNILAEESRARLALMQQKDNSNTREEPKTSEDDNASE